MVGFPAQRANGQFLVLSGRFFGGAENDEVPSKIIKTFYESQSMLRKIQEETWKAARLMPVRWFLYSTNVKAIGVVLWHAKPPLTQYNAYPTKMQAMEGRPYIQFLLTLC